MSGIGAGEHEGCLVVASRRGRMCEPIERTRTVRGPGGQHYADGSDERKYPFSHPRAPRALFTRAAVRGSLAQAGKRSRDPLRYADPRRRQTWRHARHSRKHLTWSLTRGGDRDAAPAWTQLAPSFRADAGATVATIRAGAVPREPSSHRSIRAQERDRHFRWFRAGIRQRMYIWRAPSPALNRRMAGPMLPRLTRCLESSAVSRARRDAPCDLGPRRSHRASARSAQSPAERHRSPDSRMHRQPRRGRTIRSRPAGPTTARAAR
jgi:hypothetical protein